MRLVLMRHGATVENAQRRYVGARTDEPLSEEGRAQCLQAGVFPQVKRVYASTLLRARQTAGICFPQAQVVATPGLEEFDFGVFEGRTAQEMECDEAYRTWVEGGCVGRCPGGESREEYVARSNAALVDLLHRASDREETDVVVVAHGGTIMAAMSSFAHGQGEADDYYHWHVGTCEGYVATVLLQGGELALADCRRFSGLSDVVCGGA